MSKYKTVNLLDLLDVVGEETAKQILSDFSCPKNSEIETFIRRNALDFAKRKMSITYLVFDEESSVSAMFALTHKAIEISNEGLSSTARRKIQRYAQLDSNNNSYMVSAFLIAQFGKNDGVLALRGNELMELAFEVLEKWAAAWSIWNARIKSHCCGFMRVTPTVSVCLMSATP